MSHLQVDYFLIQVKYTISNAIVIVTYEISCNIYKNVEVKFIPLCNTYFIYVTYIHNIYFIYVTKLNEFYFNVFIYVIRDLVGNNNNSIANCIFYLNKKVINLKMAHNWSRNMSLKETMYECTLIKSINCDEVVFRCILLMFYKWSMTLILLL
jgi:hypothetical protein